MKKKCIVNLYTLNSREDYKKGSLRMVKSAVDSGFKGDIIVFSPDIKEDGEQFMPTGYTLFTMNGWGDSKEYGYALSHNLASHQFKSFVIQFARENEYEQVMWCDCPVVFMKNSDHYFKLAEEIGVVIFNADNVNEAEYTSNIALDLMGCSLKYARNISQVYSGIMLFDFTTKFGNKVFNEFMYFNRNPIICNGYKEYNNYETHRNDFIAHRHDQSIISYVIRKNGGFPLTYGGYIWGGDLEKVKEYSPTFLNYGINNNMEDLKF